MNLYYVPPHQIEHLHGEVRLDALRLNILYMVQQAGAGHIGSAMSALPIMDYLYFEEMKPGDIFFSSKGHDCAALYAVLMAQYPLRWIYSHTFRRLGGLPGHPEISWGGIVTNTGSLGMGLSKAQGIALGRRMNGKTGRIFVLCGDGELQEGQNWEAIRNIYNRNLHEIHLIVDENGWQCDFETDKTSPGGVKALQMNHFRWTPRYCENIEHLKVCLEDTSWRTDAPKVYIVKTHKGFDKPYHAGALSEADYERIAADILGKLSDASVKVEVTERQPRPFIEKANSLISAYEGLIAEIMGENEKVVALDADLAKDCGLLTVKEKFPDRFFEFGISEQDMVSTAGGLALQSFIPIVHSFAAFLCRRANEQIYNNATEKTKIIYIGAMAGMIPYGPGLSHTCMDDIALMKTIPGIMVMEPNDVESIRTALRWAVYQADGPVYIRLNCWPSLEGMRK